MNTSVKPVANRQKRSELISDAGRQFEIIKALVRAVESAGGIESDLYRLLSPEPSAFFEKLGMVLADKPLVPVLPEGMKFSLKLEREFSADFQALVRLGGYDRTDIRNEPPIEVHELAPLFDGVDVQIMGFHCAFPEGMQNNPGTVHRYLLKETAKRQVRLASFPEFLVFGARHRYIQRWVKINFSARRYDAALNGCGSKSRTLLIEKRNTWLASSSFDGFYLVAPLVA